MIFCVFIGYSQGDVDKVIAPINGKQQFCGVKHWENKKARLPLEERGDPEYDNSGYPYLFFPGLNPEGSRLDLATVIQDSMCVKECPGIEAKQVGCDETNSGSNCPGGIVADSYPTRTIVRFCLPRTIGTEIKAVYQDMMKSFQGGMVGQYIFDVFNASTQVGICMVTSFAYCLLYIGIMSLFAEPLCWFCIVVVEIGMIGLPCLLGYKWYDVG